MKEWCPWCGKFEHSFFVRYWHRFLSWKHWKWSELEYGKEHIRQLRKSNYQYGLEQALLKKRRLSEAGKK